jgi:hypothetical protein
LRHRARYLHQRIAGGARRNVFKAINGALNVPSRIVKRMPVSSNATHLTNCPFDTFLIGRLRIDK